MDLLLNFLAAAAGAAIAGFLGVRFGFQQLRRERAFDRRLEWYEEAIARTHELRVACHALAFYLGSDAVGADGVARIQSFQDDFPAWHRAVSMARIYAYPATRSAIESAFDEVSTLFAGVKDEPLAQRHREASRVLTSLLEVLSADARRHLSDD